jgi:predicted dehydrogenase
VGGDTDESPTRRRARLRRTLPRADVHVLVVGAGSIGARHARNLARGGADVDVTDPDPDRAASVGAGTTTIDFATLAQLPRYDGIVIASPTSRHVEQARWALDVADRVLVEKPLGSDVTAVVALAAEAGERLMVGYNLRFHEPLHQYVRILSSGAIGRTLSARAWFGSWLPSWRPAIDYRLSYSARADLGGGVLFDAIHELDLLFWILPGHFDVVGSIVARVGDLDIDVEDTVKAILRHDTGVPVEVSLDYLSRRYRRGLDLIGTDGSLQLDWATQTITLETPSGVETFEAAGDVADSYVAEARCFIKWLRGEGRPPVLGEEGAQSVRLADAIRQASSWP